MLAVRKERKLREGGKEKEGGKEGKEGGREGGKRVKCRVSAIRELRM